LKEEEKGSKNSGKNRDTLNQAKKGGEGFEAI
jgi:hypothetical protein